MESTVIFKIYAAFVAPVIASLFAISSHAAWYFVLPCLAVVTVVSFYFFFSLLHKVALVKKAEARKKYLNQDYKSLKILALGNPEEASLFIETRTLKKENLESMPLITRPAHS